MRDNDYLNLVVNTDHVHETMLTAWMNTNKIYPKARNLTYAQFPMEYVWDKGWQKRKKGRTIGRITYVHRTSGDKYYLRLLLNIVKGPTSFEEIRTANGCLYPSYKEACYVLGLLSNDKEWHDAIKETSQWVMPSKLRELFVIILLFCEVTDIARFWEASYNDLSDDIQRKKRKLFRNPELILTEEQVRTYTLLEIDKILMKYGKSLIDIKAMPQPNFIDVDFVEYRLMQEELNYDPKIMFDE